MRRAKILYGALYEVQVERNRNILCEIFCAKNYVNII